MAHLEEHIICEQFQLHFYVINTSSRMFFFFFLNDPAPPEISPLPLPAPLPICAAVPPRRRDHEDRERAREETHQEEPEVRQRDARRDEESRGHLDRAEQVDEAAHGDRKSTRLNSITL